jgi:hypothetical protein
MNRAEEIVHRELHMQQKLSARARARRWSMAKGNGQLPKLNFNVKKTS